MKLRDGDLKFEESVETKKNHLTDFVFRSYL